MQGSPESVKADKMAEADTNDNGGAHVLTKEEFDAKQAENATHVQELQSRSPLGNPNAAIADPFGVRVEPRYVVVQNQSGNVLIIPDLKTGPEDMGLRLQPGEAIKLTDFYSPQEINRSKGLRWASTSKECPGVNGKPMLVSIASEDDAKNFVVPQRQKYPKGSTIEDNAPNDFDQRFLELEMRDARQLEKLTKKTLAEKISKRHGQAPSNV